jgi:hypothetical protein
MQVPGRTRRDTNMTGTLSEIKIIARLLDLGYSVFTPYGSGQRSDLIIEDAENVFWRLQCKSARLVDNDTVLQFDAANHNVTGKNQQKRHYRDDCDFFALYNEKLNKVYLIPISEVGATKAHLRLTHPKNKNQYGYRMASNYEL